MIRVGVIGGGPAGAAAALRLAQGGAMVTLFAPGKRGEKPCGGGLPSFLLPALEGFDASELPVVAVESALIENGDGSTVEVATSGLRIFRRGDLDPALAAAAVAAGARPVVASVRQIEWVEGRPRVTAGGERYAFDWLVGACGARGISRRSLGLEPVGDSLGVGASVTLDRVRPARADAGRARSGKLVLSISGVADAYCWIFPRPGGVSVGVAYSDERLTQGAATATLARFLARYPHEVGGKVIRPRYRYPIPVYGPWTADAVEAGTNRRILLVGDAAAVADPLTREGIRPAVLTGQWAAESLLARAPEGYAARLQRELAGEMERARRACELFFDDPIGQLMVPAARLHPGIARVLGELLSCRQGYTGLRRRLLAAAFGFSDSEPAAGLMVDP